MCLRILIAFVFVLSAAVSSTGGQTPSPDGPLSILLDNGQVLYGTPADEGDRVLIKLGPGSQVRLPKAQVVAVGRSLDDLFQVQLRRLRTGDIARHVELARWCLRHDLTAQAADVLLQLKRLAPRDPQVLALEQQMRQLLEIQRRPLDEGDVKSQAPKSASTNRSQDFEPVSAEALAQFTQQIQPLLLNHCGVASCHGAAGKSDFQLQRSLRANRWTQRITQDNLRAAVHYVDRRSPAESRLLLAAIEPHGGRPQPILDSPRDDRVLETLRAWLHVVADAERPQDHPPAIEQAGQTGVAAAGPASPPDAVGQATVDEKSPHPFDQPPPFQPRDAFDPEIFNRKFFPERFVDSSRSVDAPQ